MWDGDGFIEPYDGTVEENWDKIVDHVAEQVGSHAAKEIALARTLGTPGR